MAPSARDPRNESTGGERQTLSTGFTLVKRIILNTPGLLGMVGRSNIRESKILHPGLQSQIEALPFNESGLYGEKITVGWVSEVHQMRDDGPLQVLASSLGDSADGLLLIDSTTDSIGGILHRLEQLAESGEDKTIHVSRIEYANLDEAMEKSPPWIRREWLVSRSKQLLPAIFASQHLNLRSAAANNLFAPEDISRAMERIPNPVAPDGLSALTCGRSHVVGGGLDRAYGFSLHGDSTVWTTVMKVAGLDGGEPEFWVLNQKEIAFSSGRGIKAAITVDEKNYGGFENCCIEAYNANDISSWMMDVKIPHEVIHVTKQSAVAAFTELHRIFSEGRIHFSDRLTKLESELRTFTYELAAGVPKFSCERWHDDTVYSLVWAVFALRECELSSFEIPTIVCRSKSPHARFCYLRNGNLIPHCSAECEAHRRIERMFQQYKRLRVDSELTLPEFFESMVRVQGGKIYQEI